MSQTLAENYETKVETKLDTFQPVDIWNQGGDFLKDDYHSQGVNPGPLRATLIPKPFALRRNRYTYILTRAYMQIYF